MASSPGPHGSRGLHPDDSPPRGRTRGAGFRVRSPHPRCQCGAGAALRSNPLSSAWSPGVHQTGHSDDTRGHFSGTRDTRFSDPRSGCNRFHSTIDMQVPRIVCIGARIACEHFRIDVMHFFFDARPLRRHVLPGSVACEDLRGGCEHCSPRCNPEFRTALIFQAVANTCEGPSSTCDRDVRADRRHANLTFPVAMTFRTRAITCASDVCTFAPMLCIFARCVPPHARTLRPRIVRGLASGTPSAKSAPRPHHCRGARRRGLLIL